MNHSHDSLFFIKKALSNASNMFGNTLSEFKKSPIRWQTVPVSDGAQTLAQGATEQASSIEELSTMNDEFHLRWRCKERGQCRSGKRYFNDHRKEPRGKQHADEKTVRSHELDTQAQKLKKLVSVFHLPSQLYSENDDTEN